MSEAKLEPHQCEGFEGPCSSMNATHNKQNTQYIEKELNYMWLCPECQKLADAFWKDMWSGYRGGENYYERED